MGLLSQSLEDIDEPTEIELGRQLATVLLGAKPLHPDLALQMGQSLRAFWGMKSPTL